jgi:predicted MFS family arabinose efflux permease
MRAQPDEAPVSEWRRHGWIVVPCLAGNLLCSIHAYSLGPMIPPLEREFGWSRAGITGGLLIISLVALFVAPLVGMVADRFGPRRVAIPGVVLYCLALALFSTTGSSIANWWALWLFFALVNMCVAPMIWTAAINARFERRRGMALALALSGTSISAATVPLLTTMLIDWQGWRGAYLWLALIGLVTALPLVLLLFKDVKPSDDDRGAPQVAAPGPERLRQVRDHLASPSFLKLGGAFLLFTMALCVFTTNGVPVLLGEGFSAVTAASIAGAAGIGSLIGRLLGGILLDRYEARKVAAIAVTLPAAACALLLATEASAPVAAVAFLMIGLSSGVEYDACAYLAARHFGMRHFGTLFGVITGLILLSNGVAPAGANLVYDLTASYELVIRTAMALFLGSSILFYSLGSYSSPVESVGAKGPPKSFP